MAEMQYSRHEIVATMRRAGYKELADEAERVLPERVDEDQLVALANSYGVNRDDLVSAMGGSP